MKKNYLFKVNLIFSLNLYIYIFFIYDPILQLTSTDKNIVVIFFLKQLFVEYVFFLLIFNLIFFFIFFKCSIKNEYLKKFGFFSIYFLLASTIYSYILPHTWVFRPLSVTVTQVCERCSNFCTSVSVSVLVLVSVVLVLVSGLRALL